MESLNFILDNVKKNFSSGVAMITALTMLGVTVKNVCWRLIRTQKIKRRPKKEVNFGCYTKKNFI